MKKTIFIISLTFIFAFFFGGSLKANADTSDNVYGWAWGGSQDGNIAGLTSGVGWISMNNMTSTGSYSSPGANDNINYGVNLLDNGNFSGYAWSENLGWINFGNSVCPTGVTGNCQARELANGSLAGYARIVSVQTAAAAGNSGGWEGFIDLSRVKINTSNGAFSNYGWNGELAGSGNNIANGLGWINFSGVTLSKQAITAMLTPNLRGGSSPFKPDFTAKVTSSTAIGQITYKLKCNKSDGSYTSVSTPTTATSYTFSGDCTYNSTSANDMRTAEVDIFQGTASAQPTATITVNPCSCSSNGSYCKNENYQQDCGNGITMSCSGTQNCNWKEVAP